MKVLQKIPWPTGTLTKAGGTCTYKKVDEQRINPSGWSSYIQSLIDLFNTPSSIMYLTFAFPVYVTLSLLLSPSEGAPTLLPRTDSVAAVPAKRLTPPEMKAMYKGRTPLDFQCKRGDENSTDMQKIVAAFEKKTDEGAISKEQVRGGSFGTVINHPQNAELEVHKRLVVKTLDEQSGLRLMMELDGLQRVRQLVSCEFMKPSQNEKQVFYITMKKIEGPTLEEIPRGHVFHLLTKQGPEAKAKWGEIRKKIVERLEHIARKYHVGYMDINKGNIKLQGKSLEPGKFGIGIIDWGYSGWIPITPTPGAEQKKEIESYMAFAEKAVANVIKEVEGLAYGGTQSPPLTSSPSSLPPPSLDPSPQNSHKGPNPCFTTAYCGYQG
ncbi:hypothetical protein CVT24_001160 [Panaeolus cyanescens]|uniref:Protein kinase domain-containing protein n=1 Tax=Panaeolus cyanescens TaxID=181874 RepID=A0A409YZB2_9AGAR|nr:hypothetical protein CVT24_001160 [Panaeolus cyanescens]